MRLKNGQANIFNGLIVTGNSSLTGTSAFIGTSTFDITAAGGNVAFKIQGAIGGSLTYSYANYIGAAYYAGFVGSGNIGLRAGSGAIMLSNSDTTYAFVVASNRVGLNTISPVYGLDINAPLSPSGSLRVIGNSAFTSGSITATSSSVSIAGSGSTILSIDGSSGRLFSVDDSLSGSLFSVNTAAGLPVMEAFSDNTVRIGQYGTQALFVSKSRVGIGKESNLNANLDVLGTAIISGSSIGSPAFYVTNGGLRLGSTTGFNWDASNNNVGLGVASSAAYRLDIDGTGASSGPLRAIGGLSSFQGVVLTSNSYISNGSYWYSYTSGGSSRRILGIDSSNTFNFSTAGNGYVFANNNAATTLMTLTEAGRLGIGISAPTTTLDITGSSTTQASLRIRSGSAPTTPQDGDIWFDGTNLKMQIGGVTKTFTMTP